MSFSRCRQLARPRTMMGVWFVGLVSLTAVSEAQFPARPQMRPQLVQAKGTIQAMDPRGIILLTAEGGENWQIKLSRSCKVQVLGSATPLVLQPGQNIAFSAEVDKRRAAVQGKIDKLKIFTPSEHQMLGVFPVQGGLGLGAGLDGPGEAQDAAEDDLPVEKFEIGALIQTMKDGKLTLRVPPNRYFRPMIEIELAEEPEISLDLAGLNYLRLAKQGDSIQARGRQVGPNMAEVSEVIVELAQPLGVQQEAGKKPPSRPMRPSRRPSKPDQDKPEIRN